MANRRMIAKSISVSDETNKLSDFAALLFSWMIPHTDDYGVIHGSAGKIKGLVVPRRRQNEQQVEDALQEIQAAGLIYRYIYHNQEYVQFVRFDDHQEGMVHKRTAPKNPLYTDVCDDSENFREIPGTSEKFRSNLTKPNLTKPNGTKEKENYAEHITLTHDEHRKLVDKYGEEQTAWMINKLDVWKGAGGKTKSDYYTILKWVVKAYDDEHKKKQTQPVDIYEEAKRRLSGLGNS